MPNTTAPHPRIESIHPLAGFGTIGFGVFNLLLGLSLAFLPGSFGPSIASYILNYHVWAILFVVSGSSLVYVFVRNDWLFMRRWLAISLCFKFIWLTALIISFIVHPTIPILLVLWACLTYLQAVVYIYFPPSGGPGDE